MLRGQVEQVVRSIHHAIQAGKQEGFLDHLQQQWQQPTHDDAAGPPPPELQADLLWTAFRRLIVQRLGESRAAAPGPEESASSADAATPVDDDHLPGWLLDVLDLAIAVATNSGPAAATRISLTSPPPSAQQPTTPITAASAVGEGSPSANSMPSSSASLAHPSDAGVRVDPALPFLLLEDLMDLLTIPEARHLFAFVESRMPTLAQGLEPGRGKGLVLLRLCNKLLRRLSKSRDSVLGGRILVLLGKVYPIDDRSGVNLKGEFNVGNVTAYDGTPPPLSVSGNGPEEAERQAHAFQDYQEFWSLQHDLLQLPFEDLAPLLERMSRAVTLLEQKSLRGPAGSSATASAMTPVLAGIQRDFFPKYLTSFPIFALELEDVQFKRQVAGQLLMVLHFLATLTAPGLGEPAPPPPPNKAVHFPRILTPELQTTAQGLITRLTRFLEATGAGGRVYWKALRTVLQHERHWSEWKAAGCPPFRTLAGAGHPPVGGVKRKLEVSTAAQQPNLGNATLTRLWQEAQDPDGIRRRKVQRKSMPTFGAQMHLLHDQLGPDAQTPEEGIEEEYLLPRDPYYVWTTFRAAVRQDLACVLAAAKDIPSPAPMSVGALLRQWRITQGLQVESSTAAAQGVGTEGAEKWQPGEEGASTQNHADPELPSTNDDGAILQPAPSPLRRPEGSDVPDPTDPRVEQGAEQDARNPPGPEQEDSIMAEAPRLPAANADASGPSVSNLETGETVSSSRVLEGQPSDDSALSLAQTESPPMEGREEGKEGAWSGSAS